MKSESYDVVAVGSGHATSFFLHRFLKNSGEKLRVLVLEAGARTEHFEQLNERSEGKKGVLGTIDDQLINRSAPRKYWTFYTGFGGSSNCWWASTARLLPEDFKIRSTYGVGADWPLDYDELEPFYCEVEQLMNVSGDSNEFPYPRSKPYPHPPHRLSEPGKVLKKAFPGQMFTYPTARSPIGVPGERGMCCNNGVCTLCPMDAKFTVINGMRSVYEDERVELIKGAKVQRLETSGGTITQVVYLKDGVENKVSCDLAVLGANALFNPYIMLRSGFEHPELGMGLSEQVARWITIDLDGLDSFQGSNPTPAMGYMLYSGERRREKAAALIQTVNIPKLRNVRGKWLQRLQLSVSFEDFRMKENRVEIAAEDPSRPAATFDKFSPNTERALASLAKDIEPVLAALPVESFEVEEPTKTESHIMGTTVMGNDPATSVVDRHLVHHAYRNLLVLGSGTFPTAAPPAPTLTLNALSLRTAEYLTT